MYFGTKLSAISQLNRRFKQTIKGDMELGEPLQDQGGGLHNGSKDVQPDKPV